MSMTRLSIRSSTFGLLMGILIIFVTGPAGGSELDEIRTRVTVLQSCDYGTEIEFAAKKGDIVRVTLGKNPSGREEIFFSATEGTPNGGPDDDADDDADAGGDVPAG